MNRKKIKEDARNIIRGNLKTIIKPYLIVICISYLAGMISGIFGVGDSVNDFLSLIVDIAIMPLSFGYVVFLMKYTRGENPEYDEIFKHYNKFIPIVLLGLLTSIFTCLWTLLLIVPGIIAAISYQQSEFIMADGEENPMECIKKSKEMMKGYKWDYFVFMLSFFGWILLGIFTFGIGLIYVLPYISVSQILYYEELKKNSENCIN